VKVVITGGAGFIGSNLCRYIKMVSPETQVCVVDDLSNSSVETLYGVDVELTIDSILNIDVLQELFRGADSVVHLAAIGSVPRSVQSPRPTHNANIEGTFNVLEAARSVGVRHVVVASSSSVYGSNPVLPKSEFTWTRPMSPYAVTKLATEAYTNAYQASYGMKTLAFRFFNVYGPMQPANHDYAAVIPKFIDAALRGDRLQVHGDGNQSRDFTYVDTVCAAIWTAIKTKMSFAHPVNLAFGTNTTLLELIDEISRQVGTDLPVDFVAQRIGDVRASQADSSLLRELFPDLEPVPLSQGVRRTISWFETL
jgi:UDP-glucose 4-epimerase